MPPIRWATIVIAAHPRCCNSAALSSGLHLLIHHRPHTEYTPTRVRTTSSNHFPWQKSVNISCIKILTGISTIFLLISCAKDSRELKAAPPEVKRPLDAAINTIPVTPLPYISTKTQTTNSLKQDHSYASRPEVMRMAIDIAQRNQLDPQWVQGSIGQAHYLPSVAQATMRATQNISKNWSQYRRQFVNPAHIKAGVQFWKKYLVGKQHCRLSNELISQSPFTNPKSQAYPRPRIAVPQKPLWTLNAELKTNPESGQRSWTIRGFVPRTGLAPLIQYVLRGGYELKPLIGQISNQFWDDLRKISVFKGILGKSIDI